jgi:hypothetical protein
MEAGEVASWLENEANKDSDTDPCHIPARLLAAHKLDADNRAVSAGQSLHLHHLRRLGAFAQDALDLERRAAGFLGDVAVLLDQWPSASVSSFGSVASSAGTRRSSSP